MMRTAWFLKSFSYGAVVFGVGLAFHFFPLASLGFWAVTFFSFLLWLILRLLAIIGELVYGMRNDSARMLTSIERSLYHSNAITKEIRDLVDPHGAEKSS